MDLNHPLIESVFVPLAVTLALIPLLRWLLRDRWDNRLIAASIGLAVLVALVLILGAPAWPARSGIQKLPILFALLLVGGLIVDIVKPARTATVLTTITAIILIALWLGGPQLESGDIAIPLLLTSTSLIAIVCLQGLAAAKPDGANRSTMIVLVALGLAAASFNAGSLALFQVALALAAAVGGFALWNWPKPRFTFAAIGISVGGLGCFGLALLLLLLTQIRPWMLLPLPFIFVTDVLVRRLPVPAGRLRSTIEPLYIAVFGLVLSALVVVLVQTPPPADDIYYR